MADILRIKRRPVGGAAGAPTSLIASELAFNEVDNTLYYGRGNSAGMATNVIPIAGSGAFLPLGGGSMTGGDITLARDPSQNLHAVTKQYVDRSGLVINVKSYGAIGNGTADDTAAIQAAVTAAGTGGTIFFPAGTYRITSSINLAPGVSVMGVGPASIVAPATTLQVALSLVRGASTDVDITIHDIQIAATADNCVGIRATFANSLSIHDLTITGCASYAIDLDRCSYYAIEDIQVRSSMSFTGGPVRCQDSTSAGGSAVGGNGTITRVRFAPMTGSPFGQRDACIRLISQPTTNITECYCAWGSYGGGPISFIIIENQCQGNIIADNIALGVDYGILIQPGPLTNPVMPAYLTIARNAINSFGGIACYVAATAALMCEAVTILDNFFTEPQRECTAATVVAGGSGYAVGALLQGPTVPAAQEGSPVFLRVASVGGGGAIASVTIYNKGLTQTPPVNPVAFSGGGGSGATFNLTYSAAAGSIWLAHTNDSTVRGNFCLTYGGNKIGAGIVFESVSNIIASGNRCTGLDIGMYCLDTNCVNLIITHNNLIANNTDFGGPQPQFSILQDNIGVPWLSGTPALPATGVSVTNTAPYSVQIFIQGGAVFGITYSGISITNGGPQWNNPIILTLRPGFAIAVAYTVAPSWTWIPML